MMILLAAAVGATLAPSAEFVAGLDPRLAALLRAPAPPAWDWGQKSAFFCALRSLDAPGAPRLGEYRGGESSSVLTRGRVAVVRTGAGLRPVAILGAEPFSVPGVAAQQLVLFDHAGRVLDRVGCGINSRYGDLVTEVPARAPADGAELVVRFVPNSKSGWHNWHAVTHGGRSLTFRAQEKGDPVDWAGQGLLRVAVRGEKFAVAWPDPAAAE